MSSTLEPAIWSCDTGLQIPCFDSCQLTMKWISSISNCKDVSYIHKLTQVDLCIFWVPSWVTLSSNKDLQRLHLSPQCGHVTLVRGFLVWTAVNWHEHWMSFSWCEPLLTWGRHIGGTPNIVVVIVRDSMPPRAIPLAILTMKKETHGFHNFYAWFPSVCPISIGMGLCALALWASEALLIMWNKRENN